MAAARVLLGLSQQQLAEMAGIHVNAVKRFEAGLTDPKLSTIEALAAVFRSNGIEFLEEEPDREGLIYRKSKRAAKKRRASPRRT